MDHDIAKEARFYSVETALLLPDSEFKSEDFGEADPKWYLTPMTKPVTIHLSGHRLDVTHVVVDSQNQIVVLPRSKDQGEAVCQRHNDFVNGLDRLTKEQLIQHIAMLQKRLDAAIPGRVPRRGPKTKAEKAQEAAA